MIKSLALLFVLMVSNPGSGFDDVLKQSATEHKKTLLVFSGSDWCRGCIAFKTNVLDTDEFNAYSKTELNVFIADFPRDKSLVSPEQLSENQSLADRYNAKGVFPHVVLFGTDGKPIKQRSGGFNSYEKLKAWVEQ